MAAERTPAQLVMEIRADQRRCWQNGERVPAEAYFARHPEIGPAGEEALEIVYQEVLLRERAGQAPRLEEYLGRFPDLASRLPDLFDVHRAFEADSFFGSRDTEGAGRAASPGSGRLTIAGYEVLGLLGRGGMGVVYKARQINLDRVVALKTILAGQLASEDDLQRFRNEAEAAANLQHPNIVAVHDVGDHQGLAYFSMEYVEGSTLAEMVRDSPLTADEAARHVRAVAEAVHYAHQHGVLHRDLKPSNVLIDSAGRPRVTDFGLAKRVQRDFRLTATGQVVGTPSYMPPEQAAGKHDEVGPASDVYALGAILYELVTGRPPFRAETPFETLVQVIEAEPAAPRLLNPKVPRDLETICLKCLQKEPGRRYAGARDLVEDLGRFLGREPIKARPVGAAGRAWRWCRRKPVVAALLAGLLLAFSIGFAGVFWQWRRAEGERDVARQEGRRADSNFRRARDAVARMLSRVGKEQLVHVPHSEKLQRALLEDALEFNLEFLRDNADDPAVRSDVSQAYLQVGAIRQELGHAKESEQAYSRAIELFEQLAADFPDDAAHRQGLLEAYAGLGIVLTSMRQWERADEAFRRMRAAFDAMPAARRSEPAFRYLRAGVQSHRAFWLHFTERYPEAAEEDRQAIALTARLVEEFPDNRGYKTSLATSYNQLGATLARQRRFADAEGPYRQAMAVWEEVASRFPGDEELAVKVGTTRRNLARTLRQTGQVAASVDEYRRTAAVFDRLVSDFPSKPLYHSELGQSYTGLAQALDGGAHGAERRRLLDQAVRHAERAFLLAPTSGPYRRTLVVSLVNLAALLVAAGEHGAVSPLAVRLNEVAGLPADRVTAAGFLAACVALAEQDAALSADRRREAVADYAGKALVVLREGLGKGVGPSELQDGSECMKILAGNFPRLKADLDRLRQRPEFQRLLSEAPR